MSARVQLACTWAGGRSGVSTGAGPVTLYQGLGAAPRRTTNGATAEQKAKLHQQAADHLAILEALHRAEVPAITRTEVPPVALRPFRLLLATAELQELKQAGRFDGAARRQARARAREVAEGWAMDLLVLADRDRAERQAVVDGAWALLEGNDPPTLRASLDAVFRATRAPVVGIEVDGETVVVRLRGPVEAELPQAKPTRTKVGAKTVGAFTKSESASWFAALAAGRALVAAKQVFAHGPGVRTVKVIVEGAAGSGGALLAARIQRVRLQAESFRQGAFEVLERCSDELLFKAAGRTRELVPIEVPPTF